MTRSLATPHLPGMNNDQTVNPADTQNAAASALIDELGGTQAVAELFQVRPPSVSGWKRHGIPHARMQTLRLLRPELASRPDLEAAQARRSEPTKTEAA